MPVDCYLSILLCFLEKFSNFFVKSFSSTHFCVMMNKSTIFLAIGVAAILVVVLAPTLGSTASAKKTETCTVGASDTLCTTQVSIETIVRQQEPPVQIQEG
jgi:hypothetical protein